jgi:hypothetical protein
MEKKPYTVDSIINQLQSYPEFSKKQINVLIEKCVTKCTDENDIVPPEQLRMVTILAPIAYVATLTNGGQKDQAERCALAIASELPIIVKKYSEKYENTTQHSARDVINIVSDIGTAVSDVVENALTGLNTKIKQKVGSLINTSIRYLSLMNIKERGDIEVKWLGIKNVISGSGLWDDIKDTASSVWNSTKETAGELWDTYGQPYWKTAAVIGLSGLAGLTLANSLSDYTIGPMDPNFTGSFDLANNTLPYTGTNSSSIINPTTITAFNTAANIGSNIYSHYVNKTARAEAAKAADESAVANALNSQIGVGIQPNIPKLSAANATAANNLTAYNTSVPSNMTYGYTPNPKYYPHGFSFAQPRQNTTLPQSVPIHRKQVSAAPVFNHNYTTQPTANNTFQSLVNTTSQPMVNTTTRSMVNSTSGFSLPPNWADRMTDDPLSAGEVYKIATMNTDEWKKYVQSRGNALTTDEVNARYSPPTDRVYWHNYFARSKHDLFEDIPTKAKDASKMFSLKSLEKPLTPKQIEILETMDKKDWKFYNKIRGEISRDEYATYANSHRTQWFSKKNKNKTHYGRNIVSNVVKELNKNNEFEHDMSQEIPDQQTDQQTDTTSLPNYPTFNPNNGETSGNLNNDINIQERLANIPGQERNIIKEENEPEENVMEEVQNIRKTQENKSLNEELTGQDPGKFKETGTKNIDIKSQKPTYNHTDEPSSAQTNKQEIHEKQPETFPNTSDISNVYDIHKSINPSTGLPEYTISNRYIEGFDGESKLVENPDGSLSYIVSNNMTPQDFVKVMNIMHDIQPPNTPWTGKDIAWTALKTVAGIVGLPITVGIYTVKGLNAIDPLLGNFVMTGLGAASPYILKGIASFYSKVFENINSKIGSSENKVLKGVHSVNNFVKGYIDEFKSAFTDDELKSLGNVLSQSLPAMVQDYAAIKQRTAVYNQQQRAYTEKQREAVARAKRKQAEEQRKIDIENQNIDLENARALQANKEQRGRLSLANENKKQHYKEDLEEYKNIVDYNNASDIVKMRNAEAVHKWNSDVENLKASKNKYDALINACESGIQAVTGVGKAFLGIGKVETATDMIKDLTSQVTDKLNDSHQYLDLARRYGEQAKDAFKGGDLEKSQKLYDQAVKYERQAKTYFDDSLAYNEKVIKREQNEIGSKYGFAEGLVHNIGNIARSINDYKYWSQQKTKPIEEFVGSKKPPLPRAPDLEYIPDDLSKHTELLKKHLPNAPEVTPEYVGPPPTMPVDMYSTPQTLHVIREVIPNEIKKYEEKRNHDKEMLAYLKSIADSYKQSKNLYPVTHVNPGPHTPGLQTVVQPLRLVKQQQQSGENREVFKTPKHVSRKITHPPLKKRRY